MSLLWSTSYYNTFLLQIVWYTLLPYRQCPNRNTATLGRHQQVQKIKKATISQIAHTFLRAWSHKDWYFDNGCSRHMTGENNYLKEIKPYSNGYVTFSGGAKWNTSGKGKMDCTGLLSLNHVLLVKGLTTNIINIIQLYDQEPCVKFNQSECIITNKHLKHILKGTQIIWQNLYMVFTIKESTSSLYDF